MESQSHGKPRVFVSAFICERVLREEGGLLTAVRLVDAFQTTPIDIHLDTPEPRIEKRYLAFTVGLIAVFVCEQRAEFTVSLRIIKPNGELSEGGLNLVPFVIESGVNGYTLNVALNLAGDVEGTYWFEIYVDQELATKLPLAVLHQSKESYKETLQKAGSALPAVSE